ncbi:MAG: tRNA pseudouridine(38-40) synthase TruA [Erysipelotrichaceae bacterium]|nr:tRNA pseudouridine(38-40) synthase TruA [Erysipelotrichaceae bacterium]MDD3923801.1 tRNA pseudouridine(38-40) synthase TruA [Erysipelotrichaceae bacterium]MDD4641878.1 tRNA pseudouridine(38-40) synthase TruA [Erysipelotrichaceae bacterium]
MKRYKAIVSYDGSRYHGWQSQLNAHTIQDVIELALFKMHKHNVRIIGSGRTDKGVHALNQVFHFDSELNIDENKWSIALNSYLPKDIYIKEVKRANDDFHARYDVIEKTYHYYINMGEYDPLACDHILQLNKRLDLDLLNRAKEIFVGTHDFGSFCQNSYEEVKDQVKTIYAINMSINQDILCLEFIGNGFLRYMVRMITQTLIEAGLSKVKIEQVKMMLDACDKKICPYNAKPEGLYLVKVKYQR